MKALSDALKLLICARRGGFERQSCLRFRQAKSEVFLSSDSASTANVDCTMSAAHGATKEKGRLTQVSLTLLSASFLPSAKKAEAGTLSESLGVPLLSSLGVLTVLHFISSSALA